MHQETCQHDACAGVHEPGRRYYVSVQNDASDYRLLLGPYDHHQEALDNVDRGRDLAHAADPRAFWYAYGTCSMEGTRPTIFGR